MVVERIYMKDNVDVVKELAVKNKEIYLNKLDLDIDSNHELLKLTTTNIINLSINEVVSGVLNIENSFLNKGNIELEVDQAFNDFLNYINGLYKKRFKLFKTMKDKDNYVDYIDNKVIDDIRAYYLNHFVSITDKLSNNYSEFEKERLDNYINKTFYSKFMIRIFDVVKNANLILINNYHESTRRYHLINEKTLK